MSNSGTVVAPEGRIGADAFTVFGATVLALGVGFLTSIVVARLLGPEGRGLLGVAYSVSAIAVAVGSMGVPIAISYYASRRPRLMPRLLGSALAYAAVFVVVLLALAVVTSASRLTWPGDAGNLRFWALTALLTWVLMLEFISVNTLRARFMYARTNLLLVLGRITTLVLTVALVAVLDLGTEGALVALVCGSVVYTLGALPFFVRKGIGISRNVFAAMIGYGWRVQVGRLIQIGNGRLDVLILSAFASLSSVGIYVVAQVVAELVMLVPTAIGFVALPVFAQGAKGGPNAGRTVRLSGSLSLLGVAGVALFGPLLIYVGYGSAYAGALVPLYILLPGIWLFGVGSVIADVFRGRGRPGVPSVLAGIAIVVTVVLDLLLIPRFEAVGAAIASTCAYAVYGLASAGVLAHVERIRIRDLLVADRGEQRMLLQSIRGRLFPGRSARIAESDG